MMATTGTLRELLRKKTKKKTPTAKDKINIFLLLEMFKQHIFM